MIGLCKALDNMTDDKVMRSFDDFVAFCVLLVFDLAQTAIRLEYELYEKRALVSTRLVFNLLPSTPQQNSA